MGRALGILLLFASLSALGQNLQCDASEVRFDLSAPGPLSAQTVGGQSYYRAGLQAYLQLLGGTQPLRLLPTVVVGASGPYVTCQASTLFLSRYLYLQGYAGSLPPPLGPGRVYVLAEVLGDGSSLVPSFTPIASNLRLAQVYGLLGQATVRLWFVLEVSPTDAFAAYPATGSLTLTYSLPGFL